MPHKYEFLNRRNNIEKNVKKISTVKCKSSLKEKQKVVSPVEIVEEHAGFDNKLEERNQVEIKAALIKANESLSSIDDSEVPITDTETPAIPISSLLLPASDESINCNTVESIETIRDHNYYRYLNTSNGEIASSTVSTSGSCEVDKTAENKSHEIEIDSKKQNKADSYSSSMSAFQIMPVLLSPDKPDVPVYNSNNNIDNFVVNMVNVEENDYHLLPIQTLVSFIKLLLSF